MCKERSSTRKTKSYIKFQLSLSVFQEKCALKLISHSLTRKSISYPWPRYWSLDTREYDARCLNSLHTLRIKPCRAVLERNSDSLALPQPNKAAPPTAHKLYFMLEILQWKWVSTDLSPKQNHFAVCSLLRCKSGSIYWNTCFPSVYMYVSVNQYMYVNIHIGNNRVGENGR